MDELNELIDELIAKAGPTVGCIKINQDPDKVARLKELGWEPKEKEPIEELDEAIVAEQLSKKEILLRILALEATVADHEARIKECSIRR